MFIKRKNLESPTDQDSVVISRSEYEKICEIIEDMERFDLSNLSVDSDVDSSGLIKRLLGMKSAYSDLFSEILESLSGMMKSSASLNDLSRVVRDRTITIHQNTTSAAYSTNEMNGNMTTVSAATEELSVNMSSISDAASESRGRVNSISASTSELTTAAQEIASSTERATVITGRAIVNVNQAAEKVSGLQRAASEIGEVTTTISEISDQTKLLALNATIEAARAGEAGKGFAVVAREVKELALQTREATRNIQQKIEVIQTATAETGSSMESITEVINEVNDVVNTIAAASEEQSVTTSDIASNIISTTERIEEMTISVEQGAEAVQDVNVSITDSASLSTSVAESVNTIQQETEQIQNNSIAAYAAALETSGQGEAISESAGRIKLPPKIMQKISGAESVLCRFTKAFDVKVNRMNDDHGEIFEGINRVNHIVKNSGSSQAIAEGMKNLYAVTRDHFSREEEMLRKISYPDMRVQEEAHKAFLSKIDENITLIESGEPVDLIEVLVFLRDWLKKHIQGIDKNYADYCNKQGIF